MEAESQVPQTDQEHELCWTVFCAAPEQTTKGELRTLMSRALHDHRSRNSHATRTGSWRHQDPLP